MIERELVEFWTIIDIFSYTVIRKRIVHVYLIFLFLLYNFFIKFFIHLACKLQIISLKHSFWL